MAPSCDSLHERVFFVAHRERSSGGVGALASRPGDDAGQQPHSAGGKPPDDPIRRRFWLLPLATRSMTTRPKSSVPAQRSEGSHRPCHAPCLVRFPPSYPPGPLATPARRRARVAVAGSGSWRAWRTASSWRPRSTRSTRSPTPARDRGPRRPALLHQPGQRQPEHRRQPDPVRPNGLQHAADYHALQHADPLRDGRAGGDQRSRRNLLTVSGNNRVGVFAISARVTATITGQTISNGTARSAVASTTMMARRRSPTARSAATRPGAAAASTTQTSLAR